MIRTCLPSRSNPIFVGLRTLRGRLQAPQTQFQKISIRSATSTPNTRNQVALAAGMFLCVSRPNAITVMKEKKQKVTG
jgi:hypothetical protein